MKSNLIKLSLSILIIFILLVSFTINILALEESVKSDIENFEEDSVVKEISFKGLENIEENKIREKMEIKIGDRLDKKILKKDLENISDLKYFQNVSSDISKDKGGIKLIIEIVENPQLKEVNFTGEKIYNKGTFLEITELEIGKVINIDHVSAGLENLEDRLEKDGYIPIYHSGQGRHFIDYENIHLSQEGILEIPINVGVLNQIELSGNEKTKDHVILDEINLNKGDYLRIPEIQSEIKDLYMLEYFEEITPDFHFVSPNSNKVNLELIFQERRTGGFEFGFTYSGVEGLLGRIIFREKNLLGYGQTLGLQLQLGGKRDLNLNFRDPGLLGSQLIFGFNLFDSNYKEKRGNTLKKERGGSFTLGHPISESWEGNVKYKLVDKWLNDKNNSERTSSITLNSKRDTRDHYFFPKKGELLDFTIEYADSKIGSDSEFTKLETDIRKYFSVRKERVWAARLGLGTSLGGLPTGQKYTIGGSETHRGFDYGQFSGEDKILTNLEYRFLLEDNMTGVLFSDIGYAWEKDQSITFSDLRYGVGLGIRAYTPMGELRFDYGWNDQGDGNFHFSVGQTF